MVILKKQMLLFVFAGEPKEEVVKLISKFQF